MINKLKKIKYNEWNIIKNFFKKSKNINKNVAVGIGDDCAVLNIKKDSFFVITTDTLVLNTHFLDSIKPKDLGYKSASVNLSDLASMGAVPKWILLSITIPKFNKSWISSYSEGLFDNLNYFNVKLIGGDLNKGPLSITITACGTIPKKKIKMTRSGAKINDLIYITGTLGDSAAGLAILMKNLKINNTNSKKYLLKRHFRPSPRIREGIMLSNFANSACDISDGILIDLKKILSCSNCGANIYIDRIPMSNHLLNNVEYKKAINFALNGGEDYELCVTVPIKKYYEFNSMIKKNKIFITYIGNICSKKVGLKLIGDVDIIKKSEGYKHF
ncbi:thiL [Wigglesworthia glossinidia endosymbiont of Glossina brevipalpis]|uniref:Thiamine-monophosphate kinase n=1 Tax=Wigglesworthia glossinidia brevipalpis TaxID=36870 RepID=Q8D289_WIGBR|nr:thiL [Wigglesworthia glossinidia endosymbiont of Glossina brevipalpis]